MQWLRWYEGTVNDPKFTLVARKSGQPRVAVIAVWAAVLEYASAQSERGTLDGLDAEVVAAGLDMDEADVSAILKAFADKGLIADEAVSAWGKRQFSSDHSTERVRRFREKGKRDETLQTVSETVGNAPDTEQIQNRTEVPPVVPQGGRTKGRRFDLEALPEDWRQWARENGHGEPEREFDRFRDYWMAQPGQKGVKADWLATWRNWIRRTVDEGKAPPVTDAPVSKGPRPTITLRWHGGDLTNYRQRVRSATGTGFPVWLDRLIPEAPGVTTGPEPPEGVMAELSRWADRYDVTFERAA